MPSSPFSRTATLPKLAASRLLCRKPLIIAASCLFPALALSQGAPELRGKPTASESPTAPLQGIAQTWQSLADQQRNTPRGAADSAQPLQSLAEMHISQWARSGADMLRQTELPFLRRLEADVSFDFNNRRTALRLRTLEPLFESGRTTGLLQLGTHNKNQRLTSNAGLILRRQHNENLIIGANSFLDYEWSKQHWRGSLGLEAMSSELRFFGNAYIPLSSWRGAKRDHRRDEMPARGWDAGLNYHPGFVAGLTMKASFFRWYGNRVDVFDSGQGRSNPTGIRYGLDYKPVPLMGVGIEQSRVMGGPQQTRVQLGITINIHEPLHKQLKRNTSSTPSLLKDVRQQYVEREDAIVLKQRFKADYFPLTVVQLSTTPAERRLQITGTTLPHVRVAAKMPDGSVHEAVSDRHGNYLITSAPRMINGLVRLQAHASASKHSQELVIPYTDPLIGDLPLTASVAYTLSTNAPGVITGKTEPGATVELRSDGTTGIQSNARGANLRTASTNIIGQTKANGSGDFRLPLDASIPSGTLLLRAFLADGRSSETMRIAHLNPHDRIVATPPAISQDAVTGLITVSGLAQPGSTVTAQFPGAGSKSVIAEADGYYSITSDTRPNAGEIHLTLTTPEGVVTTTSVPQLDNVPVISDLPTVTTSADGRAVVTGRSRAGNMVVITFPDSSRQSSAASSDGRYTFTSTARQPSGDIRISITSTAGTTATTIRYGDTTPPAAALITDVTTHSASGLVTVSGTAEPGATVIITLPSNEKVEAQAGPNGQFSAMSTRDTGSGVIHVVVRDAAGNVGPEATRAYLDSIDATPPAIDNVTIKSLEFGSRVRVTGRTEPNTAVSVQFGDAPTQTLNSDASGGFEVTSNGPLTRPGTITITATDVANNQAVATPQYDPPLEIQLNAATVINQARGRVNVTGRTFANTQVSVSFPTLAGAPSGTVTTMSNTDGIFAATSPHGLLAAGAIQATASDRDKTATSSVSFAPITIPSSVAPATGITLKYTPRSNATSPDEQMLGSLSEDWFVAGEISIRKEAMNTKASTYQYQFPLWVRTNGNGIFWNIPAPSQLDKNMDLFGEQQYRIHVTNKLTGQVLSFDYTLNVLNNAPKP